MKSFLVGATSTAPTAGATDFQAFVTNGAASSWVTPATIDYKQPLPHAITLDLLRVNVVTAPGTGKNFAFTVLKNGSATALTCTISGTNTSAQDLTHTVSFAAGDTITLQGVLDTGGTAPGIQQWTARQDASGLFAILGSLASTSLSNFSVMGENFNGVAVGDAGIIVPCAGTIENLYVNGSGAGPVVTILKNGSATTLTVTLAGATGHDTTHTVSVAAGDRIAISVGTTGQSLSWGVSFAPTIDGQSFIGHIDNGHNTPTASTSFYQPLSDGDQTWDATETNTHIRLQACTILGLYSETSVSPGVSPKAYTFTVRKNLADTSAAVTINDASGIPADNASGRAGNITGQSIAVADDDKINIKCVPASTPGGLHAFNSILLSVPNPSTTLPPGLKTYEQAVARAGFY